MISGIFDCPGDVKQIGRTRTSPRTTSFIRFVFYTIFMHKISFIFLRDRNRRGVAPVKKRSRLPDSGRRLRPHIYCHFLRFLPAATKPIASRAMPAAGAEPLQPFFPLSDELSGSGVGVGSGWFGSMTVTSISTECPS